jgi:hypothetical protein
MEEIGKVREGFGSFWRKHLDFKVPEKELKNLPNPP